ncbi:MAG: hypothetical protein SCARUB_00861 [Candidatus Scalindua rubra]|uniref:Uncharacterized protein n=1 Tax=Candidatus Scalindua rubra TaxID=1872076 RepID=A0A1E3XEI4_9BACT|nr:MAG: hypothetical protein SCARUB_00861 [Candidatus Scalindua rubra]
MSIQPALEKAIHKLVSEFLKEPYKNERKGQIFQIDKLYLK